VNPDDVDETYDPVIEVEIVWTPDEVDEVQP